MTERRMSALRRREHLVDVGERLFAAQPYDEVLMGTVAEAAGISRALLYRHFPSKPDLFAAVYQRAADRLLSVTALDPSVPLAQQVTDGLDAHIDYFVANRNTVLAANRVLAAEPVVQAIIADELAILSARLLNSVDLQGQPREAAAAVLQAWLIFVRVLCVDWLADQRFPRAQLVAICLGALVGALPAVTDSAATWWLSAAPATSRG